MSLIPDLQETISEESFEQVKYMEQVSQYSEFKQTVDASDLVDVTDGILEEAVILAKNHQKGNADLVKERTLKLGTAAGTISAPLNIDLPVTISLTGTFGATMWGYGRLFSKEGPW